MIDKEFDRPIEFKNVMTPLDIPSILLDMEINPLYRENVS